MQSALTSSLSHTPPSVAFLDCRLRQRQTHRCLDTAGVLGHPGEHGAEQPRPLPAGQTGSDDGKAHRSPPGVSDGVRNGFVDSSAHVIVWKSLTVGFLFLPQDKPANSDQSHGTAHGAAADSWRLRQTGAAAAAWFSLSNTGMINFLFLVFFFFFSLSYRVSVCRLCKLGFHSLM